MVLLIIASMFQEKKLRLLRVNWRLERCLSTALPEDQGSVPSTCIWQPISSCHSSSSEPNALFWPAIVGYGIHLHIIKNKNVKKLNNLTKIGYLKTSICRTKVQCDGHLCCIPGHCVCDGHGICAKLGSGTNSGSSS